MGVTAENGQTPAVGLKTFLVACLKMTKPGISFFIGFTSATALLFQENLGQLAWHSQLSLFLGSSLSSAGSAVFNQFYESDLDRLMARTRNRPLPEGILTSKVALTLSAILLLLGLGITYIYHGIPATACIAAGAFSYIYLYTMLSKRRTILNIPIGGLCGMFAALAGAFTPEGFISIEGITFAIILYLWSSPHFWSLAILRADDYKKSGIPMLPVKYGSFKTALAILFHTIFLPPLALVFYPNYRIAGMVTLGAGILFVIHSIRLVAVSRQAIAGNADLTGEELEKREVVVREVGRQAFLFSLMYLSAVFLSLWFSTAMRYF